MTAALQRRLAAIMLADVVGYSRIAARVGRAHVYPAACLGFLGQPVPAREARAEVNRIHLDPAKAWVQIFLPYERTADSDRLVDGLRKAGLP